MLDRFRPKATAKSAHSGGKSLLTRKLPLNKRNGLIFIAIFAVVGASLLVMTRAATAPVAFEPETGALAAGATSVANTNASGGRALAFAGAATPAPTPVPTSPPIGNPAWRGDYQTSFLSGWESEQQMVRAAQQARVTAASVGIATRAGFPYVGRFIVAPGDYTNGGTQQERSEVYASMPNSGSPAEGVTTWWAWSVYLPAGFQVDSDAESPVGNGWLVFGQWHIESGTGGGGLGLDMSLTKGTATPRMIIGSAGSTWVQPNPFPLGRWVDMKWGVTWGSSSTTGRLTVKQDGVTLLNNVPTRTLQPGQSAYFKQGIYRSSSNRTHTAYYTATRRGPTEASVSY